MSALDPSNEREQDIDELQGEVVSHMRTRGAKQSIEDLVEQTEVQNREEAKTVLRGLVNDGKVSTTPDWEYKLASRLRK